MSEMEVTEGRLLSQDFGVGGPPAAMQTAGASQRPIELITQDIKTHQMAFQYHARMMLAEAIDLGRYLEEAKAALPHGRWGAYLKDEIGLAPSTAQSFMRIFREYGDAQQSLFGGTPKSQTFGNLTYSKALRLLAIPDEEERERFAIENDVEHMSVRELNEALKAKDEAEEKAIAAEEKAHGFQRETDRLREELADQSRVYKAKLTAADVETTEANRKAREAQEALEKQQERTQRLQDALSGANASVQAIEEERARLVQKLEELSSRPIDVAVEVDAEAVEAARNAAITEMTEAVNNANNKAKKENERRKNAEEALAAAQKELDELKAKAPQIRELTQEEKDALTAEAVEQARAADQERLADLKKQLTAADGDVSAFRVHYDAWQNHYGEMIKYQNKVDGKDKERAAILRNATKSVVEQWWNMMR